MPIGHGKPASKVTRFYVPQTQTIVDTTVSGGIVWAQDDDAWALTAAAKVSGPVALTQGGDSWAITATAKAAGSIAWTQAGDSFALTGAATVSGPAALAEGADTWSLAGGLTAAGAIAFQQAADAWSLAGVVTQGAATAFGGHYAPKKRDDTADDIRAALAQLNRVTSAAETIAGTDAVQLPRFEPAYDRLIEAMNIARLLVDQAETRIERTRLQVSIANAEDARKQLLAREQAAKTIAKARARRAAAFLAVILGDE